MLPSICIPEFLQESWPQIEPIPTKKQMTQEQEMKVPCYKLSPG